MPNYFTDATVSIMTTIHDCEIGASGQVSAHGQVVCHQVPSRRRPRQHHCGEPVNIDLTRRQRGCCSTFSQTMKPIPLPWLGSTRSRQLIDDATDPWWSTMDVTRFRRRRAETTTITVPPYDRLRRGDGPPKGNTCLLTLSTTSRWAAGQPCSAVQAYDALNDGRPLHFTAKDMENGHPVLYPTTVDQIVVPDIQPRAWCAGPIWSRRHSHAGF